MWVSWWKSVQFNMEILLLRNENSRLTYCCYLVICISPFMVIAYLLIKGLWIIYQKSQNEVILPNTFSLWFILAQKTMESLIFESFDTIFYDITEMSWKQPWTLKKTMVGDRIHRDSGFCVLTGFWQDVSPFEVWQFDKKFSNEYNFYFHCRLSMGFGPSRFSAWQWLKRVPFYPTPVAF